MKIEVILFIFLRYTFSKLIEPKYNFGNQQNFEIDLLYNHLLGQNLYFINSDGGTKTQFSVTLYPSQSLEVTFKFYTNNTEIKEALEDGKVIFFGIDLNISNTDITLDEYMTDIMGCELTKKDAKCYDYVYNTQTNQYMRNEEGAISKNNLIPLGFDEITLNMLTKNVIGYDHYYSVSFSKSYPEKFDNITMFNWINYVSNDMENYVSGFYSFCSQTSDWTSFKKEDLIYYNVVAYGDGAGLEDGSSILSVSIIKVYFILFIVNLLL